MLTAAGVPLWPGAPARAAAESDGDEPLLQEAQESWSRPPALPTSVVDPQLGAPEVGGTPAAEELLVQDVAASAQASVVRAQQNERNAEVAAVVQQRLDDLAPDGGAPPSDAAEKLQRTGGAKALISGDIHGSMQVFQRGLLRGPTPRAALEALLAYHGSSITFTIDPPQGAEGERSLVEVGRVELSDGRRAVRFQERARNVEVEGGGVDLLLQGEDLLSASVHLQLPDLRAATTNGGASAATAAQAAVLAVGGQARIEGSQELIVDGARVLRTDVELTSIGQSVRVDVDVQSGRVRSASPLRLELAGARITHAPAYPQAATQAPVLLPLPRLTTSAGPAGDDGSIPTGDLTLLLQTSELTILNDDRADGRTTEAARRQVAATDADVDWTTADASPAELTAAAHLARGAQYAAAHGLALSGPARLVHTNSHEADAVGGCAAWYDPATRSLHFGRGCGDVPNYATSSDLLLHELGHALVNQLYLLEPDGEPGALGEGLSDYLAATLSGDPTVGEGILPQPRQLQNARTTQDWRGDIHDDGQIVSGALWDVRSALGTDRADTLLLRAVARFPSTFEGLLYALLAESDPGGDPSLLSSEQRAILVAFQRHGIGPGVEGFLRIPTTILQPVDPGTAGTGGPLAGGGGSITSPVDGTIYTSSPTVTGTVPAWGTAGPCGVYVDYLDTSKFCSGLRSAYWDESTSTFVCSLGPIYNSTTLSGGGSTNWTMNTPPPNSELTSGHHFTLNVTRDTSNVFCGLSYDATATSSYQYFPVNTSNYAWGENTGFIHMAGSSPTYGAVVANAGVTGYIWGENTGWIHLDADDQPGMGGGIYGVTNDASGNLDGYAWSENCGYIHFKNGTTYSVVINGSTGDFSGYAWSENCGYIHFSGTGYTANTTWRANVAPTLGAVSPNSGWYPAGARTFTSSYNDANGAADINEMMLLINTSVDGDNSALYMYWNAGACYVYDSSGDANGGSGYAGSYTWKAAPFTLPWVTLNSCSRSNVGNTATITWYVTFNTWNEQMNEYMYAVDSAAASVGWSQANVGTFGVDTTNPTTSITSPATGTWIGANTPLTIAAADAGGSGLNLCQYKVWSNGTVTRDWTTYTCNTSPTVTVGAGQDCRDQYPLTCVVQPWARDGTITNELYGTAVTYNPDWTAPTGGAFTINSGASYTGSTGVTLNVTCPSDSWATVQVAYGNGASPTNWATCSASIAHTLTVGDGLKTVYVRFRDGGGNTTSDLTQTITLDTTAPARVSTSVTNTGGWWKLGSTYGITVTASDGAAGAGVGGPYGVLGLVNFTGTIYNGGNLRGYFCFHPTSGQCNATGFSKYGTQFTCSGSGGYANQDPSVTYGNNVIDLISCSTVYTPATKTWAVTWNVTPLGAGFGDFPQNHQLSVYTSDAMPNYSGWGLAASNTPSSWGSDGTAPSGAVTVPANGATVYSVPSTIQGTAADATSGVGTVTYTYQDLVTTSYWTGSAWGALTNLPTSNATSWASTGSLPASLTSGRSYRIIATVTDVATNSATTLGTHSFTYILDTTAPTLDSVTVSSPYWKADDSTSYTITAKATENGSGFGGPYGIMTLVNYQGAHAGQYGGYFSWHPSSYVHGGNQMSCTGGGYASQFNTGYGWGNSNLLGCTTSNSAGQQTVNFTVRMTGSMPEFADNDVSEYASDGAGNLAGWNNFDTNFSTDRTVPTGTISAPAVTKLTTPTLTLTASDNVSGVATMQFSCDNATWTTAVTYAASYGSFNIASGSNGCATTDGARTVYARYTDGAGFSSSATISAGVFLDRAAPTGGSITHTNGYQKTSTTVALTVSDGTDPAPASGINTATRTVQARSCAMSGAGSCAPSGGYSTVTTAGTYPNLTHVGTNNTCYQYQYLVQDVATNQATYVGASTICLDTTAPASGSITYTNGYQKSSTTVALTVADGTETGSGVNAVSRTVQARSCAMSGAGSCAPSGGYSTVTTVGTYPNLTHTGANGFCYQYQYLVQDNATNQATYVGASTICLDTTPPGSGSITHTNGYQTSSTTVALTVNDGTDGYSGVNTATRTVQARSCAMSGAGSCAPSGGYSTITTAGTYPNLTHVGTNNTCYQYQYLVQDVATNQATYVGASTICLDTTAPASGSITYTNGYQKSSNVVALTVADGTETGSGVNAGSRTVQARSCAMSGAGSCAPSGGYSTITTGGTYPNLTHTGTNGSCYQYQYLVQDVATNQATYVGASTICLDSTAPASGSITYTNGYQKSSTTVALTVSDGADSYSGVNTATRTVQARSCAMSGAGVCFPSGGYSTVTTAGTYPNLTHSGTNGNCYYYQYLVQDSATNQATYTSGSLICLDTSNPDVTPVDAGAGDPDRSSLTSGTWFKYSGTGSDDQLSFSWATPSSLSGSRASYVLSSSASSAFDETGLTAGWSYDDTWLGDLSGNGNVGVDSSSGFEPSGMLGGARLFSSGGSITYADNVSLDIAGPMSIELWYYPTGVTTGYAAHPIQKWTGTGDANYVLYYFGTAAGAGSGTVQFFGNAGGVWQGLSPAYAIALNQWTHLVWTYESGVGGKLYVNGAQYGSTIVVTGALATNTAPLLVGNDSDANNMSIDELRLYSRALTAAEVADRAAVRSTASTFVDNVAISEGTSYLHVRGKTNADKLGPTSSFTVRYDKTTPTVALTTPVNSTSYAAAPNVTGTAADAHAGVATVTYVLTCASTNAADVPGATACTNPSGATLHYWTGSQWTLTPTTLTSTCTGCTGSSVSWTGNAALPGATYLVNNVGYTYQATATDAAGNSVSNGVATWIYAPSITLTVTAPSTNPTLTPGGAASSWYSTATVTTNSSGGFTLAARRGSSTIPLTPPASALSNAGTGYPTFNAAQAVDGSTSTVGWTANNTTNTAWILIDHGAGSTADYTQFRVYAAAAGYTGIVGMQYSDDGSSWIPVSGGSMTPSAAGWNTKTFTSVGAHRYWRYRPVTTSGAGQTFYELELSGTSPATLMNGSYSIADKTAWSASSPNGATYSGTGLGFRIDCAGTTGGYSGTNYSSTWWGAGGSCATADGAGAALYAGLPSANQTIVQNASYTGGVAQTIRLDYQLAVPSDQTSGNFTGTVELTATTIP